MFVVLFFDTNILLLLQTTKEYALHNQIIVVPNKQGIFLLDVRSNCIFLKNANTKKMKVATSNIW